MCTQRTNGSARPHTFGAGLSQAPAAFTWLRFTPALTRPRSCMAVGTPKFLPAHPPPATSCLHDPRIERSQEGLCRDDLHCSTTTRHATTGTQGRSIPLHPSSLAAFAAATPGTPELSPHPLAVARPCTPRVISAWGDPRLPTEGLQAMPWCGARQRGQRAKRRAPAPSAGCERAYVRSDGSWLG